MLNIESTEPMVPAAELRAAKLRAHYDAAYLAALQGRAGKGIHDTGAVKYSNYLALESTRTYAARMAELDKLIEESE